MPAKITVESVAVDGAVHLGDTFIPNDPSSLGTGEKMPVSVLNSGDTHLREITVEVGGETASNIQLAVDINGTPGVWTDVGRSIMAYEPDLAPGERVKFWVRSIYTPEDAEGLLAGDLVIAAISS